MESSFLTSTTAKNLDTTADLSKFHIFAQISMTQRLG